MEKLNCLKAFQLNLLFMRINALGEKVYDRARKPN